MPFSAKVIKVFIACPSEMDKRKKTVRKTIMSWNINHSEEHGIVYLPISWDTNFRPGSDNLPQDYIDAELLDACDILIALFGTTLGSPTPRCDSATVWEVERNKSRGKNTMIYFSNEYISTPNVNVSKLKELQDWKKSIQKSYMYAEFSSKEDLCSQLNEHLSSLARSGKFRVIYDSDILAEIKDDHELAQKLAGYFPKVSFNVLKKIHDEKRNDEVWEAMVYKLAKSPAELRDALIMMARYHSFHHTFFEKGYKELAAVNQTCFGEFMRDLYFINSVEFWHVEEKGLFKECTFKKQLLAQIKKIEEGKR